jgi:hypothetical protein
MISPRSIRMTPNRHATGALAANDTDSMARECDSRLDGIVVLGVFHNSDIDSPGNRRRPGDRVMFRGAALILLQLPSVASLWRHRHGLPSVSHCSPNTHVISMPSCGAVRGGMCVAKANALISCSMSTRRGIETVRCTHPSGSPRRLRHLTEIFPARDQNVPTIP